MGYIERHDLYIPALRLWSRQPNELKVSIQRRLRKHLHLINKLRLMTVDSPYTCCTESIYCKTVNIQRRLTVSPSGHGSAVLLDLVEALAGFVLGERFDRAMVAYEQAHAWRQLFALAISEKIEVDELTDMCERVSGELDSISAASIH